MALKTTCIKNVKFKIIKTRTGCQYVGYFCYSENPELGRTKPSTGRHEAHGLDIARLDNFFST